ncbi:hypothetical protein L873DRAFT_1786911 [Choiromyces venosus 120613-1]|uniref:Uncharacterized protein n=1 Tax=Choiromyces venosus 120613-1 TaxID=1336337 RepID=A0A3N4JZK8_9PEZI|nr:hypothetical protein L873DRAFT_1786911 [Choiromyces venosus 120613-1]
MVVEQGNLFKLFGTTETIEISATKIRHLRAFARPYWYHKSYNCGNAGQNRISTWVPIGKDQVIPQALFLSSPFRRLPIDSTRSTTVASGNQEMKSMQKWVLAILFATFGAKFWLDSLVETKIRNKVEAGDNRLEKKIDKLRGRMKEHIRFSHPAPPRDW